MRKEHVAWSDDLVPCLHFFFRSPLIIFACDCGVPNARWENCMTLFSVLPFIFCYTVFVGICMTCILIILKKSTGVAWQERNTLWLWGKKKPAEAKRNQQKTEMITRKRHPSINICDLASPILATLIWADQCTSFSCLCLFYRPLFNRYSLNAVSTELLASSFFIIGNDAIPIRTLIKMSEHKSDSGMMCKSHNIQSLMDTRQCHG